MPPSVYAGLMMAGSPTWKSASIASVIVLTIEARGFSRPIRSIASRNSRRSSAMSMASRSAPISSTPNFSSTPVLASVIAVFSPVCPPIVGSSASGRSFSMILATISGVIGSIYVASAMSGSVMIVAGFELTRMTR